MAQGKNWKEGKYIPMVQVVCSGKAVWANPSKPNEYRCTKCGSTNHPKA